MRFFVDADLLGVGMALAQLRKDVTYPGHPAAEGIVQDTTDPVWLPIVGGKGWIAITKDRHIRSRPGEILAVYQAAVRLVVITGNRRMNSFDRMRLLLRHWDEIEDLDTLPGPWIWSLTQGGLRQMCPPWPGHIGVAP